MEQLVLGIFQEQLAKVIIGFRKEQVNANLLNGKGEIRDVSLNCSLFNEAIARLCPYIRMEEIHVSRLGFHVTSWTNLRKAPIIVDVGNVTAKIEEPFSILPRNQRRRIQMITESELIQKLAEGFKPVGGAGSYGLMDRIVDNLTIEIESFRLEFQTWGKFKTKRPGPWTPPLLRTEFKNLKICSVDADGSEGSPDQVWAHNQGRRNSFLMYKKVTGECKIQAVPKSQTSNQKDGGRGLSHFNMEVQIAVERRLWDGAVLACQLDVTIPEIDIDIDSTDIRLLAHLASGIQYCISKDRSFDDPLKSLSESDNANSSSCGPSIAVDVEGIDNGTKYDKIGVTRTTLDEGSIHDDGSVTSWPYEDGIPGDKDNAQKNAVRERSKSERSVILLPNDLIIHKSVTFTCSIQKMVIWASYPGDEEEGCLEFVAKGCVAEAIWPKLDGEHGLYMQVSTSFVSLEERVGPHQRVLLLAGMQRDDHLSLYLPSRKPQEIHADEFFPLFERRSIRDDPLDLRHLFPTQAFGLKTTIDVLHQSKDGEANNHFMLLHEIGGNEIEVVLDTDVILRITKFITNTDGEGLDPRWDTGDWSDILTPDMLRKPLESLHLDECLQKSPQLFLDENSMISSDLLNVTARLCNVAIRIPSAVEDSLRSCDIILKWKETTFVVSSDLPRTFLTGQIGNSINGEAQKDSEKGIVDFPNDPSDICYRYEEGFTGKATSTFRFQLTPRGFEVNIIPVIPFCTAPESQKVVNISDSTMIFSFEGEPPEKGCNRIKIAVFISILIQELILNIDFDILAGATCTLLSHRKHIVAMMEIMNGMFSKSKDAEAPSSQRDIPQSIDEKRIEQSFKGRRILASRHVSQSRETGGLAIIFSFQQKDFRLRLWRQNVPISSPLRDNLQSHHSFKCRDDKGLMELVNLLDFEMEDLEVGIEFDFHSNSGHRTVVKTYLKHAQLRVVDLAKQVEEHRSLSEGPSIKFAQKDTKCMTRHLINLCTFGNESMPYGLDPSGLAQQFAFRLEAHHKNNVQSWSMAIDISAPSTINLDVLAVKTATILITEALLVSAWSNDSITTNEAFLFPPGTIGAMFCLIAQELLGNQGFALKQFDSLEIDNDSSDPILERFLRSILPYNLQVLLIRCEIANLLISIPSEKIDEKKQEMEVGVLLNQTDVITRFYPVPGSPVSEIEQVLACKGTDWSTLINTNEEGFYQHVRSRQCLLSIVEDNEGAKLETVVNPFEITVTYSGAEVHISMGKGILIDDIRLIENIQFRLKSIVSLSSECLSEVHYVVEAMVNRQSALEVVESKLEGKKSNEEIHQKRDRSFSKARNLLKRANEEFSLYENSARESILKREIELETLKIDLFKKERERFGALSLVSFRVAGWIRMGGQHRSGQRVIKKSLLWPFWAILRKELLILSPRPGEPNPSDIVSLVNARLRKLAGGNSKQDTKRGFAIVENSGMVRYFVTACAQEYELWTNEINCTIRLFSDSTKQPKPEDSTDVDTSEFSMDGIDNEKVNQRTSVIGNRLSSAFQSARLKGKELSDRRQSSQTLDQLILEDESSKLSQDIQKNSAMNDKGRSSPVQDPPTSKRAEISKKFSEVGLVTKSRFGSAIKSARNKREEITSRRKAHDVVPNSSERSVDLEGSLVDSSIDSNSRNSTVGDQDVDGKRGPLGPRTGLQLGTKLGSAIQNARMKARENIEKQGRLQGNEQEAEHKQHNSTKSLDPIQGSSLHDSTSTILELGRTEMDSFQSSIRSTDSVRQEENNKRNSRFSFLKRTEDTQNDALFGGDLLTLKNIYAGEDLRSLPNAPQIELPLKMLKERWIVKVSEMAKTDLTAGSGISFQKSRFTNTLDNLDEKAASAKTEIASSEVKEDNAHVAPLSSDGDRDVSRFLVKVLQVQRTETAASVEKEWSFGDVLRFYSVLSEAIEDTLTQEHGKLSSIWNESSVSLSGDSSTTSIFEKVMVCGRALGGLLEARKSLERIEGFRRYQCESIENFLNSLLECPLPIDGLVLLCGSLGINEPMQDFQLIRGESRDGSGRSSPTPSVVGDTTVSNRLKEGTVEKQELTSSTLDDRPGHILNLLTACELELQQIESKNAFIEGIQRGEIATHAKVAPSIHIQPIFYEPLVPPSLTEYIHNSIQKALTIVMAQRDEAHAQLIGANVMHSNSLERIRRKNERLKIDAALSHDIARVQLKKDLEIPNIASIFGKPDERVKRMYIEIDRKIEKVHNAIRNDDGDAEMMQLCSQLASEISTKTSLALEIERVKETSETERKIQLFQKKALQDEMRSLRNLLETERLKSLKACAEAAHWKALYEECRANNDGGA